MVNLTFFHCGKAMRAPVNIKKARPMATTLVNVLVPISMIQFIYLLLIIALAASELDSEMALDHRLALAKTAVPTVSQIV